jgi:hypothetical protein
MPDEPDATDAYREFAREMMLRFEAAIRAFSRDMAALRTDISGELAALRTVMGEELRAQREEMRAQREETRELREESRAQMQALMHILDRLENGGAAAG